MTRIKAADYTDRHFEIRGGFDLDKYLETSIDGHQSTSPIYTVKLRFSKQASAAAEDQVWNRTQKQSWDSEGRLIVEFRTGALYAVERQVLGWGGAVEVITPPELVASLHHRARALLEMHG